MLFEVLLVKLNIFTEYFMGIDEKLVESASSSLFQLISFY